MEKAPWIDRGTVAGSLAAGAVLLLWLFSAIGKSQGAAGPDSRSVGNGALDGARNGALENPASGQLEGIPSATDVPTSASDSAVPTSNATAPWAGDPRWAAGIQLGKDGLEQAKKAEIWKEKEGGDPFYYRNQIFEAGEKVGKGINTLSQLKGDFSGNEPAVQAIEKWIEYFDRSMPQNRK